MEVVWPRTLGDICGWNLVWFEEIECWSCPWMWMRGGKEKINKVSVGTNKRWIILNLDGRLGEKNLKCDMRDWRDNSEGKVLTLHVAVIALILIQISGTHMVPWALLGVTRAQSQEYSLNIAGVIPPPNINKCRSWNNLKWRKVTRQSIDLAFGTKVELLKLVDAAYSIAKNQKTSISKRAGADTCTCPSHVRRTKTAVIL